MDNDELDPYYYTQGQRLLYALVHFGLIADSDVEGERGETLCEFIGMELQDMANSAIRWHMLIERGKRIIAERQPATLHDALGDK